MHKANQAELRKFTVELLLVIIQQDKRVSPICLTSILDPLLPWIRFLQGVGENFTHMA